jgi:hypothetical protein
MTRAASAPNLGSEFDAFLFAPVGEDRNGMLLSVLSALVRLDVDPWLEAAKLARLPGKEAARRLAGLIAGLPDGATTHPDPGPIAARLIALLPHPADHGPDVGPMPLSGAKMSKSWVVAIYVAVLICVVGAQIAVTDLRSAPRADGTGAYDTTSSQAPPPGSGQ